MKNQKGIFMNTELAVTVSGKIDNAQSARKHTEHQMHPFDSKGIAMISRISFIVVFIFLFFGLAVAQDNIPLTRDEVSVVKKKLVNALDSIGQSPAGYTKESENFNLPSEVYKMEGVNLFAPVSASVDQRFGSEKSQAKSYDSLGKEYEKKIAEAQARGDYQAMSALSQEMLQKANQMQKENVEGKKIPIYINIYVNTNPGIVIDPDSVLFESTGVIALKNKNDGTEEKGKVSVFFDPINLKDPKQLSKIELYIPEKGVNSKTAVYNMIVDLEGPLTEIEGWAKRIDTGKVLAQIDRK